MAPETPPEIETATTDGVTVVTVIGPEMTDETRDALYEQAARLKANPQPRWVVLSLANVKTLRSVSIGVLVNFQKRVRDAGGVLKLCSLSQDVSEIFRMVRLDDLFETHRDEHSAVASFRVKAKPSKESGSWLSRLFRAKAH